MSHVHVDFLLSNVIVTIYFHMRPKIVCTLIASGLLYSNSHGSIRKHVTLYVYRAVLLRFRPQNSLSDFCTYYRNTLHISHLMRRCYGLFYVRYNLTLGVLTFL